MSAISDIAALAQALESGAGIAAPSLRAGAGAELKITTDSYELENGDVVVYDRATDQQCGYLTLVRFSDTPIRLEKP